MKKILSITLSLIIFAATSFGQEKEDRKKNKKDQHITIKVFQKVDKYPEFPGGIDEMKAFIKKNQQFPEVGSEVEFDGVVKLLFLLKADGSISHETIKVEEGLDDDSFNQEAIRILKLMPKWTPAYSSVVDKNVDVWVKAPVRFRKTVTYQ